MSEKYQLSVEKENSNGKLNQQEKTRKNKIKFS